MVFNEKSRRTNIMTALVVSAACNILNILANFAYRTVFIRLLSIEYLGINGLFTNILSVLSLTDMGIAGAILYRMYKPIKENDIEKVGQLMNFFKWVYHVIILVIFVIGLSIVPFLPHLIKDTSEVPADINLTVIYILFLSETISTYLFAYKQTLLSADQKQYVVSFLQFLANLSRIVLQIIVLMVRKDFALSLGIGIFASILVNFIISLWIDHKYKPVFKVKSKISKEEKQSIFKDTRATMYHKVGGIVLSSTDSIILSKFISLAATGMYANYSLISRALYVLLAQVFDSFTASFGNLHVSESKEVEYLTFKRLFSLNLWIVGLVSMDLFLVFNDFIEVWAGKKFCFNDLTVLIICLQFYIESIRFAQSSFTNATGLFVKDRFRPLIESCFNLGISIFCVLRIGLPGVFLGTIISHLMTVSWREPYILYRYEFKKSMLEYGWIVFKYTALTAGFTLGFYYVNKMFVYTPTFLIFVIKGFSLTVLYVLITFIFLFRSDEFKYYMENLPFIKRK